MSTVKEIQTAIRDLPEEQALGLLGWMETEFGGDAWDRQMQADAAAGRLDHLVEQAKRAVADGTDRPFP
ncbi:MAG: hypothetical protein H8E27_13235 [Verrucomicrobia subdivision 3 bacterium]|nr:hypothetical protein [Limisphaerales bacterium]